MDYISEQRLSKVILLLRTKVEMLSSIYEHARQSPLRVVQGLRSWQDQARIYAQGRTAPGEIVTDAPPGHSYHEFGLAVDIMPSLNPLGVRYEPDPIGGSPRYLAMVEFAENCGLVRGFLAHHVPDWPHLQVPGLPASPTDHMRSDFAKGGLELVWQSYSSHLYIVDATEGDK